MVKWKTIEIIGYITLLSIILTLLSVFVNLYAFIVFGIISSILMYEHEQLQWNYKGTE